MALISTSRSSLHPFSLCVCNSFPPLGLAAVVGNLGCTTAGSNFTGNFSSIASSRDSGQALSRASTFSVISFTFDSVGD
ncbi:hypothetical protein EUGRSUZ_E04017 [Eucalyptus grandis]|uniref:Uncharacterized protein n=2 Tax=Eucalyptus grandis TaxID=71139 RepID=A0ACC3L046_EUCGR|nr:hypothetical protein EUGRSUZ_E04017 [Eucalyptus grandis]